MNSFFLKQKFRQIARFFKFLEQTAVPLVQKKHLTIQQRKPNRLVLKEPKNHRATQFPEAPYQIQNRNFESLRLMVNFLA